MQLVILASFLTQNFWFLIESTVGAPHPRSSASALPSHPPHDARALAGAIFARDSMNFLAGDQVDGSAVMMDAIKCWAAYANASGRPEMHPISGWKFGEHYEEKALWFADIVEMERLFLPFQYCLPGTTMNLPAIDLSLRPNWDLIQ
jgi:hypothetical protein